MSLKITQIRKMISSLEDMTEEILKQVEKINFEDFSNTFNDLKEGLEETIDDLSDKDRLTQAQEERLEQYESLMEDLDNLMDDVEVLNELNDKLENLKDMFSTLNQTV